MQACTCAVSMQAQVKEFLKGEGQDLATMPCCIVNQSSLAIDARDPVQLVKSMEKLVGTWTMRQQLQETDRLLASTVSELDATSERRQELGALRLSLRPAVSKLLQCNELLTRLQKEEISMLEAFSGGATAMVPALTEEVRLSLTAVTYPAGTKPFQDVSLSAQLLIRVTKSPAMSNLAAHGLQLAGCCVPTVC